jgi:succinate-acetate transporter protein
MATPTIERRAAQAHGHNGAAPAAVAAPTEWGNSAPLALAAFAITTFMLSMVNAGLIPAEVTPVVFGVALMFGGLTQLLAGLIQLRTGKTFSGVLFCGFGAFWLSLFAIAQFFLSEIPVAQHGHALGLFLYAFGFFAISITIASFRTNAIVVVALLLLTPTIFALAAGQYGAHTGLTHVGGYLGLAVAALALYLSCAETCEATYGRSILPIWPLTKR